MPETGRRLPLPPDARYPDEARARYRAKGYWRDETLAGLVRGWEQAFGPRTALVAQDRAWTYATLIAQARRFGHGLLRRGLQPGDTLVLHLANGADFVVAFLASLLCGVVPVMALPALRQREISHVAQLAEAVAYLGDAPGALDLDALARSAPSLKVTLITTPAHPFADWPEPDDGALPTLPAQADDIALLLLSGGTTGLPKLIARTHADYAFNARASGALCAMGPQDRYLAVLPMAHNFPLACPGILGAFEVGAGIVVPASPAPEDAFDAIARHRASVTALVPSLARLWLDALEWEQPELSSLRLMQVGGAKLDAATAAALSARIEGLQQVFGMAEGLLNFTRLGDGDGIVFETQGRPLCPDDDVRIVGADGNDVPDGEAGELLVRGPYTIRGYYRAGDYNHRAFTPDGYYRSGDRVRRRGDGYLVVEGRIKDVVIRNGESIAADEIEACLRDHPRVRDAAVFADTGGEGTEAIHAVLVCDETLPLSAMHAFLKDAGVARFKWPDRLSLTAKLPLTPIGKVDKRRLALDFSGEVLRTK